MARDGRRLAWKRKRGWGGTICTRTSEEQTGNLKKRTGEIFWRRGRLATVKERERERESPRREESEISTITDCY